jgi:hypothetical protein
MFRRKIVMTTEQEIKMFGCTKSQLIESIESEGFMGDGVRDAAMLAMSLMSDCQEMLNRGQAGTYSLMQGENVRQALNRAKFILATYVR